MRSYCNYRYTDIDEGLYIVYLLFRDSRNVKLLVFISYNNYFLSLVVIGLLSSHPLKVLLKEHSVDMWQ